MNITWSVTADFDRDGVYEYDLTGDIEMPGSGITIDRGFGKDGIYQISKVSIGEFYSITQRAKALFDAGTELSMRDYRYHFFAWWDEPKYCLPLIYGLPCGVVSIILLS